MNNPISVPLPQDLPTNWTYGQTVAPTGAEVGLPEQYGYNYLMAQVNAAQKAAAECGVNFANAAEITVPSAAGNFAALDAEGNLQDSRKTASDFAPAPLSSNLTLYVNTETGSDSNDGLTAEQPKKTIMSAVNAIPKNLGGYKAEISIAAGTYPEAVMIEGFYGANYSNNFGISLIGADMETVSITGGIAGLGCRVPLRITDLSVSGSLSGNVVSARQCTFLSCASCSIDGSGITVGSSAVYFEMSNASIYYTTISNTQGAAVLGTAGTLYANDLSGNSNSIGIQAGSDGNALPALIVVGTVNLTAETKYKKVRGGVVLENGVLV